MRRALSYLAVLFALSLSFLLGADCAPGPLAENVTGVQPYPASIAPAEAEGTKRMVCSLTDQRLYFFEGEHLVNIMRCSTGVNDSTPTGEFTILNHHLTHGVIWGSVCDYWMGFTSSHGIHAWPRGVAAECEAKLGSPASPGCITLHPHESQWPYYWAPDGTPLTVTRDSLARESIPGCHDSMGVTAPSRDWYFAEGYTAGGFETYILLSNPGEEMVQATVSFFPEGGAEVVHGCSLPPRSRFTLLVDGIPQLSATAFSAHVHADGPVVAERAVYFGKGHIDGGHASLGIAEPSPVWDFAEGCTGDLFQTYLLLGNPGDEEAKVEIDYYTARGRTSCSYLATAHERTTILVNEQPGLEREDVSCTVRSDRPLVAERAVYYDLDSRRGGHASPGTAVASTDWFFAEGYTGEAFETFLLISNPGTNTVRVGLDLWVEGGFAFQSEIEIPPGRRSTIKVDELPGLARAAFSTHIHCDVPIVAERAMYFAVRRGQ
jgi:hypothetical protein